MSQISVLKTNNLMKTYKQGENYVYAVNRLTVAFPYAKLSAIIGPSGSGKSTLLHILGGLDIPSGGEVWVRTEDGLEQNLYAMTPAQLTAFRGKHFGFVYQNYELLPILTAMENILIPCIYGGAYFDEDWFRKLVDILGLGDRLHHLPSEMSGGEQQRVAMARALIHRPRILFADEPTGNLDSDRARELMDLLLFMRDEYNQTVVMVTHDLSLADRADTVFRIRDGAVE
ncbi:MAG: ABC transporter ATP-binding protein [Ruminococcaceae bacterium]|nr:ABC transporter ATP-binding protein [Oscillospiraceae bacterium]